MALQDGNAHLLSPSNLPTPFPSHRQTNATSPPPGLAAQAGQYFQPLRGYEGVRLPPRLPPAAGGKQAIGGQATRQTNRAGHNQAGLAGAESSGANIGRVSHGGLPSALRQRTYHGLGDKSAAFLRQSGQGSVAKDANGKLD